MATPRRRQIAADEDCIILYTDAAEEDDPRQASQKERGEVEKKARSSAVSIFAYDQRDGKHYSANTVIPKEYMDAFFEERKTYIGIAEEVAGVAAFYTWPKLFKGRKVIHFVDNAGSLSHLVNGYAGRPDSAHVVNLFHAAVVALEIKWWGEWVPSKANIADIMTRPERFHELKKGLAGVKIIEAKVELPPMGFSAGKLKEWMREMRARAVERAVE